jgi:hypothetical protein
MEGCDTPLSVKRGHYSLKRFHRLLGWAQVGLDSFQHRTLKGFHDAYQNH